MTPSEWSAAHQMPISIGMRVNGPRRSFRHASVMITLLAVYLAVGSVVLLSAQEAGTQTGEEETLRRGFRELSLGVPFNRRQSCVRHRSGAPKRSGVPIPGRA